MKFDIKSRLSSYSMWISLGATALIIVKLVFGVDILSMLPEYTDKLEGLTSIILTFLIAAGIVNNPTTSNHGFADDEMKEDSK